MMPLFNQRILDPTPAKESDVIMISSPCPGAVHDNASLLMNASEDIIAVCRGWVGHVELIRAVWITAAAVDVASGHL